MEDVYFIQEAFAEIVASTLQALADQDAALPEPTGKWTNLNFQYGYIHELNETLQQWGKTEEYATKKFPCVWLRYPLTIQRDVPQGLYGTLRDCAIFLLDCNNPEDKTPTRFEKVFKPTLYPIYYELLNQIDLHLAFSTQDKSKIKHTLIERPFWGAIQQNEIVDVVDVLELTSLELIVNKKTCLPFKNF